MHANPTWFLFSTVFACCLTPSPSGHVDSARSAIICPPLLNVQPSALASVFLEDPLSSLCIITGAASKHNINAMARLCFHPVLLFLHITVCSLWMNSGFASLQWVELKIVCWVSCASMLESGWCFNHGGMTDFALLQPVCTGQEKTT